MLEIMLKDIIVKKNTKSGLDESYSCLLDGGGRLDRMNLREYAICH